MTTRRLALLALRAWPGAAIILFASTITYAMGFHRGYLARAAEEFQWHTLWEAQ